MGDLQWRHGALQARRLGPDHPLVATTLAKLAVLSHRRHRDDAAWKLWADVLRIRRATGGAPRDLAEALYGYGVFLHDVGEHEQAMTAVAEALGLHRAQELGDPSAWGARNSCSAVA